MAGIPAPANEEHAPAHLRHAVLRSQQFGAVDRVAGPAKCRAQLPEHRAAFKCREPSDVFDHNCPRLHLVGYAHEFAEQPIARVQSWRCPMMLKP